MRSLKLQNLAHILKNKPRLFTFVKHHAHVMPAKAEQPVVLR